MIGHIRSFLRAGLIDLLTMNLTGLVIGSMWLATSPTSKVSAGPGIRLEFGDRFTCLLTLQAVDIVFGFYMIDGSAETAMK